MKPAKAKINAKAPPTIFGTYKTDANGKTYYDSSKHGGKPASQSYKDQCNINSILAKAKRTGVISHVTKNADFYADMTDFDYEAAMDQIAETNSAFYELDAETRREFENNPALFRKIVSKMTPDEIKEKLPQLAEPDRQFPDVIGGKQSDPPAPPVDPAPPPEPQGDKTPPEEPKP